MGVNYAYQVTATDKMNFALTYTFVGTVPSGMTIGASSGYVQWTDPTPTGSYPITIQVTDLAGLYDQQSYTLVVSTTPPGYPPVFASTPPFVAAVNLAYQYTALAYDPQGGNVTYTATTSPSMSNFAINSITGIVTWTPTTAELGTEQITITATDTLGLTAVQNFNVSVATSLPPTISSGTPPSTITAGLTFIYQILASDPAGDVLTYSLIGAPMGMAIDQSGRITWATTNTNIGSYTYEVKVVNPDGLSVTSPSYPLQVLADTVNPTVSVMINPNPAAINSVVSFDVIASDPVGIQSLSLLVNGTPVPLDDNGRGTYTATTIGLSLPVVATATNLDGLTSTANSSLEVINPADTSAPTVSLTAPVNLAQITSPTEVTGTASDAHMLQWTLTVTPENGTNVTTIATGTTSITSGNLGLFDPTTLADGPYTLTLTAWNQGGHVASASIIVNVSGYLKMGNLSMSFNDLTVPVSGIPITITRTYNSLNASTDGIFGYGWTLSESNLQLQIDVNGDGQLGEVGDTVPFVNGTRVVITLPDGTSEGFTFEPTVDDNLYGIPLGYQPAFVPDAGVSDTLTVPSVDGDLLQLGNEYISGDGTEYNPANSEFGDTYTLTQYGGLSYTFDATYGDVLTESDLHGNTLTFESNGIYSNTGKAVTFGFNNTGQITTITDPNGKNIVYAYDPAGDLVSETDRDGNVTQFGYSAAQPHFLDQIINATGQSILNVQFNTSGRLTQMNDVEGNSATLSYNLSSLSESAIAPGNTSPTNYTYNSEGMLTQSVDADGDVTNYTYSSSNFLTSETQIVGTNHLTTTYTNNAYGEPLTETDPEGNTTYYAYDQYGDQTSDTDSLGNTTYTDYYLDTSNPNDPDNGDLLSMTDPLGNPTSQTYDSAGDVLSTTTSAGTTTNTYDQYGDVLTSTTPQAVTTTNTYDNDGNPLTSQFTWVNPSNSSNTVTMTTTDTYDGNGNLTKMVSPEGTTSSTYNPNGDVTKSVDALGGVTTILYNADGKAIQTTTPTGMVTDTVYNSQNLVIYTDDPHLPGEPCDGTHTTYDQAGDVIGTERLANVVITVSTANGISSSVLTSVGQVLSISTTTYNAAGQVVQTVDPSGMITNNFYDNAGDLIETQEIVNGVTRTSTSTYNADGETTSTTDPLGNTTQYQYDGDGDVTKTIYADGSSVVDQYNQQGEKVAEIDEKGNETQYEYNQNGNVTEVIEPAVYNPATGATVTPTYQYTYDSYGDLTSSTDALGHLTQYGYNQFGNMVSETLPMGGQSATSNYNSLDQLTSQTDFDGNTTDYTYYGTGSSSGAPGDLETKTVYAAGSQTAYETVTYAYNVNYNAQGDYDDTVTDSLSGTTDHERVRCQRQSDPDQLAAGDDQLYLRSRDRKRDRDLDLELQHPVRYDQAGELKRSR